MDSSEAPGTTEPKAGSSSANHVKLKRENTDTIAEAAAVVADNAVSDDDAPTGLLPTMGHSAEDEASLLKDLTENVRDQEDLERDITHQANIVMIEQEDERDQKRIEKVETNIVKLEGQKRTQERRLNTLANNPLMRGRCEEEIRRLDSEIAASKKDISDIQARVEERHQFDETKDQPADAASGNKRLPNESQRDFLIRTGKITPFSRMPVRESREANGDLREVLLDAEEEAVEGEEVKQPAAGDAEPRSHQNLRLPGFADAPISGTTTPDSEFSLRPRKKRKLVSSSTSTPRARKSSPGEDSADDFTPGGSDEDMDDFIEEDDDDGNLMTSRTAKRKAPSKAQPVDEKVDLTGIDDGNESMYQERLKAWVEKRSAARRRKLQQNQGSEEEVVAEQADEEEWFRPCPDAPDHQFDNDIKLPGDIYPALFDYQKTGVQWLGELYSQSVGGIVGDEMGLGKTIQIISFLAGLHYSKKLTKPIIVVAPATVLRQWVNEFHRWWPPLRVSILHSSGSGMLNVGREEKYEEIDEMYTGHTTKKPSKSSRSAQKIVDRVVEHGHVLVTTYAGLQTYADVLIPVEWDYAVLDEGHKIRNPNTGITIHCKELRTPNRVILSGTPMQNNLVELWSLFDFVFPMRLGTLVNFRQAFEVPIRLGGYANATNLQVLTATKCAETLKATISPYLLQRLKVDVAADLPKKSEQVLFCKLTKPQREAYEMFLSSDEMTSILNHSRKSLYGIDILRKICNHPDLLDPRLRGKPGYKWGNPNKSGKMQVVKALVQMWKNMGHKTLLFSQGVQMLNIIEEFIKSLDGFNYLRMDGGTNVKDRQTLVDRFNNDPDMHIFLLTTKVGGLGVNLTGANRVIIFDPDWNPSTDVQARERAWRLGQKKEVTIFRLMTAGTIEEKIYHRQIFKQFLTNKILKDPKQRQTFQMKDLYDLFSLGSTEDGTTETGEMFKGTEVQFNQTSDNVTADAANNANPPVAVKKEAHGDDEILRFDGVSSLEAFRGDPDEDKPADSESRLMEGIFANSGVHSALEHDQIINGKKKISADRGMLEREAKKIAAEAAQQLRRAGETARSVAPGTVTWTGEFGSAGRPANLRRGAGPGSNGILSGLANRQGISNNASASSSRSGTPGATERAPRGKDFMKLIQTFIRTHGGKVPTAMLVNHFNNMCKTPQQSTEFKHMLREIAVLEEGPGRMMRAKWVLKPEFK
ncbi:P-loop containing nucleoside triphosphate hydrolase [Glarea lozoyensis ATCC 20868]|uniref:p-loop containing nucleoside triphosphate hydrolase n=2 Tax=Glarea lozoyensis TaxID=101852 RepID=S3DTJ4_GLAL2|nr:P-loop containing nucleoside triphosphate hydrolase [Glarea lozoyensis ATCC 20868]EHL03554.1 putative DNA repair and recombination protein RAD26 [Glarea lozoyensis 74030]EPE29728.1 P-loop containing nucleoside triphosphate hydrolase [Glarea lozoyensis ATCC 20868]